MVKNKIVKFFFEELCGKREEVSAVHTSYFKVKNILPQ